MTRPLNGKKCKKCGVKKDFHSFEKRTDVKFGRKTMCKKCCAKKTKERATKNANYLSKYYHTKTVEKRTKIKAYIKSYLENHPCVDCGQNNPIVLDFDHVRGKKLFNIAEAYRRNKSVKNIDSEISKCDIRCSNCHRIVTHNRLLQKSCVSP